MGGAAIAAALAGSLPAPPVWVTLGVFGVIYLVGKHCNK